MNYKQKYEQVLERARTFSQRWQGIEATDSELALRELKEIFPELKESEDEKTRIEIISIVKSYRESCITEGNHRFDDCIAWLEKQGGQKPTTGMSYREIFPKFSVGDTLCRQGWENHTVRKIYVDNITTTYVCENEEGFESHIDISEQDEWKKIEQKPAENKGMNLVEEEMTPFQKKVFFIIDTAIEKEQGLKQVCDELLRLAHDEIMQNPAWSEEDEDMRDTIIRDLKHLGGDMVNVKPAYKAEIDWLKSLKDRVRQKQEWSEEDIRNIENIDSVLFYDKHLPEYIRVRLRNWLKSLKPQPRWKPSEEQMEYLKKVYESYYACDGERSALESLYNDLQKL